ncbi:MAG: hypothetical protein EP298_00980 [Gammaproteobacteria bacterium]|nr:MAG: hypothetical protein EP298_00980 [Gammaproteobacteria bacterium]UTW41926.1 hypothetical protein KFE69_10490 [bacterium SCSIO 12844]
MFEEEIEMLHPSSFDPKEEASSSEPVAIKGLIAKKIIPEPSTIENSDQLRNVNSFLYLREVASIISEKYKAEDLSDIPTAKFVEHHCKSSKIYDEKIPYGNLYSDFLAQLQEVISKLHKEEIDPSSEISDLAKKQLGLLRPLVHALYFNRNLALEYTELVIDTAVKNTKNITETEEAVAKLLSRSVLKSPINETSPEKQGSKFGRAKAHFADDFKPMLTTSIPQIRLYDYKTGLALPLEFRFGTQGERDDGNSRYNPLFKEFVHYQKSHAAELGRDLKAQPITHVYFNNLKYTGGGSERDKERALSLKLHELEDECDNLAVISIPADGNFLDKKFLTSVQAGQTNVIAQRMLDIVANNGYDFFISDRIKALLYGQSKDGLSAYDKNAETLVLNALLDKSLKTLGLAGRPNLTQAETQALYFHFLKYEFTNFVLENLKPLSFNTSCKDAIDRGGVSSLYFNLIKSIELGNPLSEDEFYRGLHAAPAMVKGRGMNHHVKLIANVIDQYIEANKEAVEIPKWLVAWRDDNKLSLSDSSEKSYKTELFHDLKNLVDNTKDQKMLSDLLEEVHKAKTHDNKPYRELWHQETGIPPRYRGTYGDTTTAREVLSYIKSRLLKVLEDAKYLSGSLDSSDLFDSLTAHSKRKSIFRPELTDSEKKIRRSSSLSEIFKKELASPTTPPTPFNELTGLEPYSVELQNLTDL